VTAVSFGVLFDFDGTLVDTFDGIIAAVQRMRGRLGAPPLCDEEIRPHIGWGVYNLIGQSHPLLDPLRPDHILPDGAPLPIDRQEVERAITVFREEYAKDLVEGCRPYPGMRELCRQLVRKGLGLAVVSNKPERFTRRIMAGHGLVDPFTIVVAGDSLPVMKPDPEPLHHAARELRVAIECCVMVGDSRIDIQAARAAGVPCCAVTWGIETEADLAAYGPDAFAQTAEELRGWILAVADGHGQSHDHNRKTRLRT
jgi:phosphoglycolate phosphatase